MVSFFFQCVQFDVSIDGNDSAKDAVRDVVKKEITPILREKFAGFSEALIKGNPGIQAKKTKDQFKALYSHVHNSYI